jgi:ornithine cyclodeaminase
VTIFDSVGFALNDFSALRYLERLNREQSGGASIDLIPMLDDPKDLYGELKLGSTRSRRDREPDEAPRVDARSHTRVLPA